MKHAPRPRPGTAKPAAQVTQKKARNDGRTRRRAVHPIVVGVGASAGGLDAFKRFFKNMPADAGIAFVLIQHLDPTHQSLTAELIARGTPMPAVQIERDTPVAANHIYVIPPNRYLRIESGVLRLTMPLEPRGLRMPIDIFLRSLAADQQAKAIGVVLSGTGTDGTLGLKEIKACGGIAMVQDPDTAEYDGMPRSAIATGGVDRILAAEKMAAALIQYLRHPYVKDTGRPQPLVEQHVDDLNSILSLLHARVNFDFGPYRKGTLVRRIQRRMSLAHVEHMRDYLRVLRDQPVEVSALFKDLLISVTSFFREPKAWQALEHDVLPQLIASKPTGVPLRVWVAGCATGEEAYSIAMLLVEGLQAPSMESKTSPSTSAPSTCSGGPSESSSVSSSSIIRHGASASSCPLTSASLHSTSSGSTACGSKSNSPSSRPFTPSAPTPTTSGCKP